MILCLGLFAYLDLNSWDGQEAALFPVDLSFSSCFIFSGFFVSPYSDIFHWFLHGSLDDTASYQLRTIDSIYYFC